MKLRYELNVHYGETVKVGAANAFVFCGIVGDDIEEIMNRLSDDYLTKMKKRLHFLLKKDATFYDRWQSKLDNAAKDLEKQIRVFHLSSEEAEKRYDRMLQKHMENRNIDRMNLDKNINSLKETISGFTNFLERDVKEKYPSIDNEGTIIIFEGSEWGSYWSVDECQRGYVDESDDDI